MGLGKEINRVDQLFPNLEFYSPFYRAVSSSEFTYSWQDLHSPVTGFWTEFDKKITSGRKSWNLQVNSMWVFAFLIRQEVTYDSPRSDLSKTSPAGPTDNSWTSSGELQVSLWRSMVRRATTRCTEFTCGWSTFLRWFNEICQKRHQYTEILSSTGERDTSICLYTSSWSHLWFTARGFKISSRLGWET